MDPSCSDPSNHRGDEGGSVGADLLFGGSGVDLRERGGFAAAERPFHFEGVAVDRVGIDIGLDGPAVLLSCRPFV